MTASAIRSKDLLRNLASTCYDGVEIRTAQNVARRFTLPAQCEQAAEHRDRVRLHLSYHGLGRLGRAA